MVPKQICPSQFKIRIRNLVLKISEKGRLVSLPASSKLWKASYLLCAPPLPSHDKGCLYI